MGHKIGVIGGDGIGPSVIAEALKVVAAAGVECDTTDYTLGGTRYLDDGFVLSDEMIDEWRGLDALLLGAVGAPGVPPGVIERGLLLKLRFDLDLYINHRPFVRPADDTGDAHDFVVVRENTEGTYAGEGGILRKGTEYEVATQGSVNTRMGVERCLRYAFDLAGQRSGRLTMVHKTNVLNFSGDLWNRSFEAVGAEYPEIETGYQHVDATCIHMVERPSQFDVIVTDNLFGDILTDLAGAVSGGIGKASSANLNPDRTAPSMFEPVHGSAPDIAGTNQADPTAAVLSAAMMLDFLGENAAAERITTVCHTDTGGGSTTEIGDRLAASVTNA